MEKRFKIRLSRFIPDCLRSRRSSDCPPALPPCPSPEIRPPPAPVDLKAIGVAYAHPPSAAAATSSCRGHAYLSKIAAFCCGCWTRFYSEQYSEQYSNSNCECRECAWREEDRRREIARGTRGGIPGIYGSSPDPEASPLSKAAKKLQRNGRKKAAGAGGWFRRGIDKEDEEEAEYQIPSSRSFSNHSDSPDWGSTKKRDATRVKKMGRPKRRVFFRNWKRAMKMIEPAPPSPESASTAEGKMRESYAVVKRSADPYEDFRRSIVEMIVENQMMEREDLEQLLRCFLRLNPRHHHGIIVEAFSEAWETLFWQPSRAPRLMKSPIRTT